MTGPFSSILSLGILYHDERGPLLSVVHFYKKPELQEQGSYFLKGVSFPFWSSKQDNFLWHFLIKKNFSYRGPVLSFMKIPLGPR